jgi:hypothetical protein
MDYLLTKIRITKGQKIEDLKKITHPLIIELYIKKGNKPGTYYTNGITVLYQSEELINTTERLAIEFINPSYQVIYKSINSFAQNIPYIAKSVNYYTINYLNNKFDDSSTLIGIGGEFISYFINLSLYTDKYNLYYGFTNSETIASDSIYNTKINDLSDKIITEYKPNYTIIYKELEGLLKSISNKINILINLSKIHIELPKLLLEYKEKINTIIIISCNRKNLVNRITYNNFTLINKKEFISPLNGSITVNHYIFNDY